MMTVLMIFLILFGAGACLGLCYVAIKATIMAVKGANYAARDLSKNSKSTIKNAWADQMAIEKARKAQRQ